jgi:two-component system, OmpR family, phosphate regulon sensor histidine kinase PhoR
VRASLGPATMGGLTSRLTLVVLIVVALGLGGLSLYLDRAVETQALGHDARATLIRQTTGAGLVLALGLAAIVGWIVQRRVARPLQALAEAADRMARGDPRVPLVIDGDDEVAALGGAFNRMVGALHGQLVALDAEQAKGRTILDGMVEGVVALDARGRLLLMNPAARAIFGVGADGLEGRPLLEVIRQKALADLVEAARLTGDVARAEVELPPPVNRTVAAQAVPLAFAPGAPGVLVVLHDVTELRRLERVRTEFVANVSHELRTPLTCIKGYLETLLDGAVDEPAHARRFLVVANAHAERLGRLVGDLLDLSNLESGRAALAPVVVDLQATAAEVVSMFEPRAAETDVRLVNRVPEGCRVRADRDRLTQILVNLVDNAVKFTEKDGEIAVTAVRPRLGVVEVRVHDTGVGIPSTDLPRISERFYRVDRTRSREQGGTGLGLAIVKHLVHAHGGELWIESLLGQGTTVRFTLPEA